MVIMGGEVGLSLPRDKWDVNKKYYDILMRIHLLFCNIHIDGR